MLKVKTYLVNLDRCPERLASMSKQLSNLGIDFERIAAVDGNLISKKELRHKFARVHSRLALGRDLRKGEIGCALSHIAIYERMVQENCALALVFEDDIVFAEDAKEIIRDAFQFANVTKPQVILFNGLLKGEHVEGIGKVEFRRIEVGFCTDAYVITLPAARLILAANYPVVTCADQWNRWSSWYGLELFRAVPSAVRQDVDRFDSDITPNVRVLESSPNFMSKASNWIFWHIFRPIMSIIDRLWCMMITR